MSLKPVILNTDMKRILSLHFLWWCWLGARKDSLPANKFCSINPERLHSGGPGL